MDYLFVFGCLLVYVVLSVFAVKAVRRHANATGKSPQRWVWGAAFVLFLIPFWDWLPTVAMHRYYCSQDSGFWVYKTLDQWKAENPGVAETLVANKDVHSANGAYILNQRFNWAIKNTISLPVNVWRREYMIVDRKNNDVLARYIDFSSGNGNIGGEPPVRFWLQSGHCSNGESDYKKFILFKRDVQGELR